MTAPEVSVVVASHRRPARLRRLLDALGEQTVPGRFETIVVHDDGPGETEAVLRSHPLPALRHIAYTPGEGSAARMRNCGWRAARAPLVAFTDDDCRPTPEWLERLLQVARVHPEAIVQGPTQPDPDEIEPLLAGRAVHTMAVEPPTPYCETCNMAYPRAVLERVGGFYEGFRLPFGEDVDLAFRARRAGAAQVTAPGAMVHHAVEPEPLLARLRSSARWSQMALVVKRNPEYRRTKGSGTGLVLMPPHGWWALGAVGLLGSTRRPALALLALPYLITTTGRMRNGRGRLWQRVAARVVIHGFDVGWTVAGSVRYRTVLI